MNQTSTLNNVTIPLAAINAQVSLSLYILSAVLAVIIITNSLTIVVIAKSPSLRTFTNAFLVSMSASDELYALFLLGSTVTVIMYLSHRFYYNPVLIDAIVKFGWGTLIYSCNGSLILVSLERWLYITQPFLYQRLVSVKSVSVGVAVIWVSALAINIPCVFPAFATNCPSYYLTMHGFVYPTVHTFCCILLGVIYVHISLITLQHVKKISKIQPHYSSLNASSSKQISTISKPSLHVDNRTQVPPIAKPSLHADNPTQVPPIAKPSLHADNPTQLPPIAKPSLHVDNPTQVPPITKPSLHADNPTQVPPIAKPSPRADNSTQVPPIAKPSLYVNTLVFQISQEPLYATCSTLVPQTSRRSPDVDSSTQVPPTSKPLFPADSSTHVPPTSKPLFPADSSTHVPRISNPSLHIDSSTQVPPMSSPGLYIDSCTQVPRISQSSFNADSPTQVPPVTQSSLHVDSSTQVLQFSRPSLHLDNSTPASSTSRPRRHAENWKAIKLLIIICGLFFTFVSPCVYFSSYMLLNPNKSGELGSWNGPLFILQSIYHCSNFFVYFLTIRKFRKVLKHDFKKYLCCR